MSRAQYIARVGQAVFADTSGNLGLGTSSPSSKLTIQTASAGQLKLQADTGGEYVEQLFNVGGTNKAQIFWRESTGYLRIGTIQAGGYLSFATGSNSEKMVLDASGNLGLGVTPSAWGSGYRAVQVGGNAALAATISATAGGVTDLSYNAYVNSSSQFAYRISGEEATLFRMQNGNYAWYTAGTGVADATITFTQAMTLDASGNWLLGRTSTSSYRAQITGTNDLVDIVGTDVSLQIHNKTSNVLMMGVGSGDAIAFATGGNTLERMRIDSSGNVGIGVTPSAWGGAAAIGNLQFYSGSLGISAGGGTDTTSLTTNAYYNGTNWIYRSTSGAARYDQWVGAHRWYTAPSGTSGGTASFTERMRIDSTGQMSTTDGAGNVKAAYDARAWVNFNGTGTVAIRASGNVSSITDGGVGLYTVNFATAMSDASYSIQGSNIGSLNVYPGIVGTSNLANTTSAARFYTIKYDSTTVDFDTVSILVAR